MTKRPRILFTILFALGAALLAAFIAESKDGRELLRDTLREQADAETAWTKAAAGVCDSGFPAADGIHAAVAALERAHAELSAWAREHGERGALEATLEDYASTLGDARDMVLKYEICSACAERSLRRLPHELDALRASLSASGEPLPSDFDVRVWELLIGAFEEQHGLPFELEADGAAALGPFAGFALQQASIQARACRSLELDARTIAVELQQLRVLDAGDAVRAAAQDVLARLDGRAGVRRVLLLSVAVLLLAAWVHTTFLLERARTRAAWADAERRTEVERWRAAEGDAQAARARAEAAAQSKSELLARISHEIRTPMTAILGYADRLLDAQLPERRRVEAVTTIRRNGEHLIELVSDILDLSKIEAGKLVVERTPCSLVQIVVEVRVAVDVHAQQKGLRFTVEIGDRVPETIVTDPTRLKQILLNVVGNAIKFTERGHVTLSVETAPAVSPHGRTWLRFVVSDSGIGMSEEQLGRLYRPFTQADATTARRFGGTGLGLAISRELVEILGGTIRAESRPGEGSRFTIELAHDADPTVGSAPTLAPALGANAHPVNGKLCARVLVVEDSADLQRLLAQMLSTAGVQVALADNGQMALERVMEARIAGHAFDAVLMDMQMPVMDGLAATQRLRAMGYTMPIVALTGEGDRRCIAAGCNEVCIKPIDEATLLGTLSRWLPAHISAGGLRAPDAREREADPELLHLVRLFVADLDDDVRAMRNAFESADWPRVATLAHRLKGTAGSYGFPALTERAAILERSARAREITLVSQELGSLAKLCAELRARAS
ncbi:MAG: ATP-binding protein [Planctomycetota bacterium]